MQATITQEVSHECVALQPLIPNGTSDLLNCQETLYVPKQYCAT